MPEQGDKKAGPEKYGFKGGPVIRGPIEPIRTTDKQGGPSTGIPGGRPPTKPPKTGK